LKPALAERIARSRIPLDETIAIALEIIEGLEEVHEQGIFHRDLKPANIKLTQEDKVKILDFGLAKAFVREGPVVDDPIPRRLHGRRRVPASFSVPPHI
jgi:serine/threonine protein kinase